MRRARGPIYHNHFTTEVFLHWRCNICTGRKCRNLTRRRAKAHGGSAKHCSKAETATFFEDPGNFTTVEILKWRCSICVGCTVRVMTNKQAMFHESSKKHYSNVATTLFNHPGIFKYDGNGKWHCHICKGAPMTVKKARAHEILCQGPKFNLQVASYAGNSSADGLLSRADSSTRNVASLRAGPEVTEWDSEAGSLHGLLDGRREGNGNATSLHREGTAFECNDDDDDNYNHSDDDDDDDENDNTEDKDDNEDKDNGNHSDNDDTAFVENTLRLQCHGVDTSRSERMQSLYEMPTNQNIQKIQETIRDLHMQ